MVEPFRVSTRPSLREGSSSRTHPDERLDLDASHTKLPLVLVPPQERFYRLRLLARFRLVVDGEEARAAELPVLAVI